MISKGTQYLTAAGFGNIRVTAASLGPLDILGTLGGWLSKATKQAINVAFGADGAAVINATNAYLNALAATDRSKAQALAALLNEDPMMVCSLGLSVEGVTMPIRFIRTSGTEYISTNIPYGDLDVSMDVVVIGHTTLDGYPCGWLNRTESNLGMGYFYYSGYYCWTGNGYAKHFNANELLHPRVIYGQNESKLYNGDTLIYTAGGVTGGGKIILFRSYNNDSSRKVYMRVLQGRIEGTIAGNDVLLLPMKRNGVLGMLDAINNQLYTNAGSGQFTEEFGYMLNGSWVTWTPQTPYTPSTP